jgi:hypothetical protein
MDQCLPDVVGASGQVTQRRSTGTAAVCKSDRIDQNRGITNPLQTAEDYELFLIREVEDLILQIENQ